MSTTTHPLDGPAAIVSPGLSQEALYQEAARRHGRRLGASSRATNAPRPDATPLQRSPRNTDGDGAALADIEDGVGAGDGIEAGRPAPSRMPDDVSSGHEAW